MKAWLWGEGQGEGLRAGGVAPHPIPFPRNVSPKDRHRSRGRGGRKPTANGRMHQSLSGRFERAKTPHTALATGASGPLRYLKGANYRAGARRFSMRWTALHWMLAAEDAVVRSSSLLLRRERPF